MQLTRAEQESFPPAQIFAGPEADLTTTDFLHVRDYVRIVTRRRWMIAVIVAAGVSAAAFYNWQAKTVFASRATLQVEADTNVLALDRPPRLRALLAVFVVGHDDDEVAGAGDRAPVE